MKLVLALAPALLLSAPGHAQTKPPKAAGATTTMTAALADPSRPEADRARDAARKPAEILAFAGVKPGHKVADFIMGGGSWTRILAGVQFRAAYGTDQDAAVKGRANVVPSRDSLTAAAFPEPLDAVLTSQNWHDFHLKIAPPGSAATMAKHLYGVLKPGGVLLVIDHVGAPGTQDSLHRGDPAGTRAEIEAAGFRFDGESPVLRNPADPHTASAFDPAIRGKTDQFVYRFRKPA
jgi:predicted methyltransferase